MFIPADDWLRAFLLTLAVEVPLVAWLLRRAEPQLWRGAAIAVIANLATHPLVWFGWSQAFLIGTPEYVIAAETWAVAVEAAIFAVTIRGLGPRRAVLISLIANGASFAVGRVAVQLLPEVFR